MTFYHGTSDAIGLMRKLLPPIITGYKREGWRNKFTDLVFFTPSIPAATMYAKKACIKYGGNPVLLEILPIGEAYQIGNGDWVVYSANIIHRKHMGVKQ